jgi:hypothetical protein
MQNASILAMANIQIRGVPDDVHRQLKSQSAMAGQSLNEFLLGRLGEIASTPTLHELAREIRQRPLYTGPSSAAVIRRARDSR